ncbi:sugar phosphate permease [Nocardioides ginsengisegetis]|uniref:Lysosomal dipeptide transporter MFSD1 n=1 Tax=Nocardioides ginsengisegetis TaxID=661491 RepID=A0A7W3P9J6_9ACTN|nr:sugar phosphate permease [Nocardioides ginsengisegetis]
MTPPYKGAFVVWLVGLLVYLLAVFHRSSLAVAGLAATERFDISASQLATFTMLQLLVYAAMQIPVGLMVDRFGPRRVMLTGTLLMTAAQTGFALAETYPEALVARLFVGMGDAMTFICVLRLIATWFAVTRIPLITQLTGTLGQLGGVLAAVPMTWALGHVGWTRAYLSTASLGIVLAVAVLLLLRDSPAERSRRGPALSLPAVRKSLAASWALPGTRLGFWIHFSTQFSSTALALLWGYPFFVRGEGLSPNAAGGLLTCLVVSVMLVGPALGWLIGLHPWHRSSMALTIVGAIVVAWTVVLLWPGDAPLPVLVLLVFVVGVGGPASMIGFDVARTSNPPHRLASASGIINQGGFTASLLLVVSIGVILDWRTPGGGTDYTPEAFRWAMSAQYVLWAVGLTQVWRYRKRARRHTSRDELAASIASMG